MQDQLLGKEQKKLQILVAEGDATYWDELSSLLQAEIYPIEITKFVQDYDSLLEELKAAKPDAILVNQEIIQNNPLGLEGIIHTGILKVVVLMEGLNDHSADELVQKGADVVYKYGPASVLVETLFRMPPKFHHGVKSLPVDNQSNAGGGKFFVVHSPKGGTGKTTIAVNLAFHYAAKGLKTLLVDGAVFGNIGVLLKIPQRGKGLSNLITYLEQHHHNIEESKFQEVFKQAIVKQQGVDILVGAPPVKMDKLLINYVDILIKLFQQEAYQVVIIDTSSELMERNLGFLSAADKLVLVAVPELTCGWNILMLKDVLTNLGLTKDKIHLIVNKANAEVGFYIKDLEQVTGYEIMGEIPDYYKQVTGFANKGTILANKGHLPINRYFKQIAHQLYPVFEQGELKTSILSNIFG